MGNKKSSLSPTIAESLKEELICPICYYYITAPIRFCTNGHCICDKCKQQDIDICPTCREPMVEGTAPIIDQISKKLEKSTNKVNLEKETKCPICSNQLIGHIKQCCNGHYWCKTCDNYISTKCPKCNIVLVGARFHVMESLCSKLNEMIGKTEQQEHIKFYNYNGSIYCQLCYLKNEFWFGRTTDYIRHCINFHDDDTFTYVAKNQRIAIFGFEHNHDFSHISCVVYDQKVFLIRCQTVFDTCKWTVILCSTPEDVPKYEFKITLQNTATRRKIQWHSPIFYCDVEDDDQCSLEIGLHNLKYYCDDNGDLYYHISITKNTIRRRKC